MDVYAYGGGCLYSSSSTIPKYTVPSKNLPAGVTVAGGYNLGNISTAILYATTATSSPSGSGYNICYSSSGDPIFAKKINEQKVMGGEPAVKGLKGNVNHDVINELSLAGVDYMQGNIFNQLFVQGALP